MITEMNDFDIPKYDTSKHKKIFRKYNIIALLEKKGFQVSDYDPDDNKNKYAFEMRKPMDNRLPGSGSLIICVPNFILNGDLFSDSIEHVVEIIIQMYENKVVSDS